MDSTFEVLVDAVHAAFDDEGVDWQVGRTAVDEQASPPRIVWVPRGGTITPPSVKENVEVDLGGKKYLAEHILDNLLRVHAHLWAENYAELERLHHRVLSAVYDTLGTACTPGEYTIDTEDARASITNFGHAGIQSFVWSLRVAHFDENTETEAGTYVPVRRLVTITNQTHACILLPATGKLPTPP